MKSDGQEFLNQLSDRGARFENSFSKIATWLGLGMRLAPRELALLKQAAALGCLCNVAFNGFGACRGKIKPEGERNRIDLEIRFMSACDALHQTPGWQALPASLKQFVRQRLLQVFVHPDNLAW